MVALQTERVTLCVPQRTIRAPSHTLLLTITQLLVFTNCKHKRAITAAILSGIVLIMKTIHSPVSTCISRLCCTGRGKNTANKHMHILNTIMLDRTRTHTHKYTNTHIRMCCYEYKMTFQFSVSLLRYCGACMPIQPFFSSHGRLRLHRLTKRTHGDKRRRRVKC